MFLVIDENMRLCLYVIDKHLVDNQAGPVPLKSKEKDMLETPKGTFMNDIRQMGLGGGVGG